ncbi:hypothetical protein QVD17_19840 [Tagetes erecta]|uniref:Uncharacterized protein n=1 Tax=Tagetes erecta TaxID=13708 RepID=A0AAD8KRM9_TARER|nr:hypothetical protein QVD17_19840 [Tagetes erecta]
MVALTTMAAPTDDGCLDEDTRGDGFQLFRVYGAGAIVVLLSTIPILKCFIIFSQADVVFTFGFLNLLLHKINTHNSVFGRLYGEAIEAYTSIKHVLFSSKSDHKFTVICLCFYKIWKAIKDVVFRAITIAVVVF